MRQSLALLAVVCAYKILNDAEKSWDFAFSSLIIRTSPHSGAATSSRATIDRIGCFANSVETTLTSVRCAQIALHECRCAKSWSRRQCSLKLGEPSKES